MTCRPSRQLSLLPKPERASNAWLSRFPQRFATKCRGRRIAKPGGSFLLALMPSQDRDRHDRGQRLHEEDAPVDRSRTISPRDNGAGEEEQAELARAGRQAIHQPGGQEAVVQALV